MKNRLSGQLIYALLMVIGLILMVGGIITAKHGATVVGIIVAAVAVRQWMHRAGQHSVK